MATMLVINGPNEGEWYTLGRRSMVFGRDDVLLAEILDPCVSRRHLEVRYDDIQRTFYAIDMQSRNGVLVNGRKIQGFKALQDEDVLQIGHTLLIFTLSSFESDDDARARVDAYKREHVETIEELERKAIAYREKMLQGTHVFG